MREGHTAPKLSKEPSENAQVARKKAKTLLEMRGHRHAAAPLTTAPSVGVLGDSFAPFLQKGRRRDWVHGLPDWRLHWPRGED
jgi:hypothetical protein